MKKSKKTLVASAAMSFLNIGTSYANDMSGLSSNPVVSNIAMVGMMLFVFYFMLIRPQQKKVKDHKNMLESLQVGAKLLVNNCIVGTLSKIDGNLFIVEVSPGVKVTVMRESVTRIMDGGDYKAPVSEEKTDTVNNTEEREPEEYQNIEGELAQEAAEYVSEHNENDKVEEEIDADIENENADADGKDLDKSENKEEKQKSESETVKKKPGKRRKPVSKK